MPRRAGSPLDRLPARLPTYALLIGSAVAVLALGLAIPAIAGGPDRGVSVASGPAASIPSGTPTDHDQRPAAAYAGLDIVPSPRPTVPLTASDVGITPTTITLGVILIGLGAISAFGIDVSSLDPSVQRTYWDTAAARVNAAGGIDGRKLVLQYATGDILSTDSLRAACLSLTEDHHVFAVANVLGVTGDPILCVSRDHATPYLGIDGEDPSFYAAAQGRLVTLEPTTGRTLTLFTQRIAAMGLVSGHRIGVLYDTGPGGIDGAALARALQADGAKSVIEGALGNLDPLVVSGQVAADEGRMQTGGADTVLLLTNAVYGTVFATQADQSRYTPTYLISDLGFATAGDSYLANMPTSFFKQALAVTTTEIGRGHAKLPEDTLDASCRSVFGYLAKRAVARDSSDAVAALASCALLQILTIGLNGAGPNPTRAGFAGALTRVGDFTLTGFGRGTLGPGRLDAAADVSVVAAHADCQCWQAIDGFRPAPATASPPFGSAP